jgi:hypothetical protein
VKKFKEYLSSPSKQLNKGQVFAFLAMHILSIPLLALSWGNFDMSSAKNFIFGIVIWEAFLILPLLDSTKYVCKIAEKP